MHSRFDDRLIAKLAQKAVYWGPSSQRRRPCSATKRQQHFLTVEAENGEDAIDLAREVVLAASGDAPELNLVKPKA